MAPVPRYRPEVLAELVRHGIVPHPDTPPERAYDLLKSIYTFELREAKQVLRRVLDRPAR